MNPASAERQLGEYRLKQLLAEDSVSRTWLAEQVSVSRLVLVDELLDENQRDAFLADVRMKASVDHPLIGSVYEAVAEPGLCFYAHELLAGATLEERAYAGETFLPARLAHILRRVSEAELQHETLGHATSPVGLDVVHLDEHGVIRMKNLAVAGVRSEEQSASDVIYLGNALVPLIASGQPGATRLMTLLGWMRGEGLDAPIAWGQIRDFCMQIEHQLADSLSKLTPTESVSIVRKKPVTTMVLVTLGVLVAIVFMAFSLRPPEPAAPPRASLPPPVMIAAGNHPTPDGLEEPLPAFRISANEITIGQYAEFLETLTILAKNNNEKTFDLPGQPAEKTSHLPDDWAALYAAAKSNGTWHDLAVSPDSPVVGVDWWDAATYAEWKKARLPTQEEWFAALSAGVKTPSAIEPSTWASVTAPTADRTPSGLIGMAGSVSEWTAKPAANPANPLGGKHSVIIGGSYLKPGSNALSREWIDDRTLRRSDLGFRVVFDAE
ncbi:MAG: SUMF1/EgtB/PvdO family nonheme iron enzyme [Luteolibacter sp.]|uniref:SUMF1/EgtB/PvdO family nonheme iron enzyme n=1 Tax=Luteolibacter sp. TaxID=1962973 RepID=UPI003264802F